MTPADALEKAELILRLARHPPVDGLFFGNWNEYAKLVGYCAVSELTQNQKDSLPWLKDWALTWRRLYDRWEDETKADPMLRYRPKHHISEEFHASNAFMRYYMAGNGTSKTQSGYAEDYFVATNQHRWRFVPPGAHSVFIIGLEFTSYAVDVFEKKMLNGEEGNYLSPMFPDGGKWFHSYNRKDHQIMIACKDCAEAHAAGSCKHSKSSIKLYSDKGSWEQLQGSQHLLGHFDEHIDEGWFREAVERLSRVPFTSLIVTGTPLFGTHAWEVRHLLNRWKGPEEANRRYPSREDSPPYVSVFNIGQDEAGIVDPEVVKAKSIGMDRWEYLARVKGQPAPLTKHPVFDRGRLDQWAEQAVEPRCILITPKKMLEEVLNSDDLEITTVKPEAANWTGWRVWEDPEPGAQYIAAVDSAKGLIAGNASCCSILKLTGKEMRLHVKLVAQYHGWINTFDYGDEVFKGAVYYGDALAIVELTGGYGEAVMLRLKKQLCYWNIFRGEARQSNFQLQLDQRMGIDTNVGTKPFMIAALQQFVAMDLIEVQDIATIEEMANFEEQREGADGRALQQSRFGAAGGALDDRVMSLAIGVSTAVSYPVFDFSSAAVKIAKEPATKEQRAAKEESKERAKELNGEIEPLDYMG